ncbi:MAG: GNAT family N-acetyltransferase [Burkholderiaceae bacterium]
MQEMLRTLHEMSPMSVADAGYLYWLCERTMRGYVEETWGRWNEEGIRAELSRLATEGAASTISVEGGRVGAIVCDYRGDPIVLEQLFIEPEHQRRGIGAHVVRLVLDRARESRVGVKLGVLKVNPAKSFYERLGFGVVGETETRYDLEWHA